MNKVLSILFLLMTTSFVIQAQYMEFGILGGASNYKGDLQSKTVEPIEIHAAYGLYARYNFSKHFAVRLQAMSTKVSGRDANHRANNPLRARNLSFESSLHEISLQAEVNVFGFDVRDGAGSSIFLFAGVGAFKFNPKAEVNGISYELQPLGTEGQTSGESNYSLVSASFPVGIGAKLSISERMNISLEYGLRFTLTDYLDDVSTTYPDLTIMSGVDPVAAALSYREPEVNPGAMTNPFGEARGDASTNDQYMVAGITLSYNLASPKKMEYDEQYKW